MKVLLFCLGVLISIVFASVSDSERAALVDFYNSLDGANWRDPQNWLNGDPCLNFWAGVSCDQNDSTVLQLSEIDQFMAGTIPMSLANLTNLQTFITTENPLLRGPIPPFYEGSMSLQYFEISQSGIDGDLPTKLGTVQNLNQLNLNDNKFTGTIPDDMFGVAQYENILLSSNQISGIIPDSLCKTPSTLKNLSLYQNYLTGSIPDCFESLTNLQNLNFAANSLTGTFPASFLKLPMLITMSFGSNQLSGSLPDGFSTTQLNILDLSNNTFSGTIADYSQNFSVSGHSSFYIDINQLTGQIPSWVCNLNQFLAFENDFCCPNPSCCQNGSFHCGICQNC